MSNIQTVQLTNTIDYQRQRLNDGINLINGLSDFIPEALTEAQLPTPASATTNIYLVRNHTIFKGAVLATIIDGQYRYQNIKIDPRSGNNFITVESSQLGTGVVANKVVYLDASGVWQLADCDNVVKYGQGFVGSNNTIIFGGQIYSGLLSLVTGTLYYYNTVGTVVSTATNGRLGVALDEHTLNISFDLYKDQVQSDFNEVDTENPGYIKNKPGVVSAVAAGYTPALPISGGSTKYLRGDGTWVVPPDHTYSVVTNTTAGLVPVLPDDSTKFLNGVGEWAVPTITVGSGVLAITAGGTNKLSFGANDVSNTTVTIESILLGIANG